MKKNEISLKVFFLSQPLLHTEWISLLGDKYYHSLTFKLEVTKDLASAQVIAWDGVITPKNATYMKEVIQSLSDKKVLLIQGEASTLLKTHPIVSQINLESHSYVELPGWSALPEEMIAALEICRQKVGHV